MTKSCFIGRQLEIRRILEELNKPRKSGPKWLIELHGIGGSGKTTLLNKILEQLDTEKMGIFQMNEDAKHDSLAIEAAKHDSLPEFADKLAKSLQSKIPHFTKDFKRFDALIETYKTLTGEHDKGPLPKGARTEIQKINKKYAEMMSSKTGWSVQSPGFGLPSATLGKDTGIKLGEIKLGTFQAPSRDPKEAINKYEEMRKEEIKRLLEEYKAISPEDQDLIISPGKQLVDALLEGMENSFYPKRYWGIRDPHNTDVKPIKVLFIFDTYEWLRADIGEWLLETLIPELETKTDIFDFRIIISGRHSLTTTDEHRRWDRYLSSMTGIDLHRFTKEEISAYLNEFEISADTDKVMDETDGVPFLVKIWTELGNGGPRVFSEGTSRLFWYKTEEQKGWILAAAFLKYYDENALAVFIGAAQANKAFEWLNSNDELTRSIDGRFRLHPAAGKVITGFLKISAPERYNEYVRKAELYREICKRVPDINDRRLLTQLSVFGRFNQEALENVFPRQGFELHNFAAEHKDWFSPLSHTFQMDISIRKLFREYARCVDLPAFEENAERARSEWERKRAEVEKKRHEFQSEFARKREEHRGLPRKTENLRLELSQTEREIEHIISMREKAAENHASAVNPFSGYPIVFPALMLILGFILSLSAVTIKFQFWQLVLGGGTASLLAGTIFLAKSFMQAQKKTMNLEHVKELAVLRETELQTERTREAGLRDHLSDLQTRAEALNAQVSELEAKISDCDKILGESYL